VPAANPPESLPGARLLFSLDPSVSHFNHGSFGAVPLPVQRVQQRLRDEMESNPLRFFANGLYDRITHARRHLASFAGADPDGTALVTNATTGVAVVLGSLRLSPEDEVVVTDHGYGAVAFAVARLCRETGAATRVAEFPLTASDDEVVAAIGNAVSGRTRLVIVDRITSTTVKVLPVPAIVAALRGTSVPVLVDAAHVPGHWAEPAAGDFWVGNLHKWGYAPRGTALLQVGEAWRSSVRAPVVSWRDEEGFPGSLEYFSTADYTAWLAAPVGTFVLRSLGLELVRQHNAALAAYAQYVVGAALGLATADLPQPGGDHPVAMRLLPLPAGLAVDLDSARALRQRIADELQTDVNVGSWRGQGLLRLTAQVYNRADEYERFAERLPAFLRRVQRQ
jgi:isopenicillin-N epimerase